MARCPHAQGISIQGNALRSLWTTALLIVTLPMIAGFGYLLFVHDAMEQKQQALQHSQQIAGEQAAKLDLMFLGITQRLAGAARSPLVVSATSSNDSSDLTLVENAVLDYFPRATGVRLLKLDEQGLARKEASNLGLRTHIELDLLRRAMSDEGAAPESYLFEGEWLTSIAQQVSHPRTGAMNAILLATFSNALLSETLAAGDRGLGRSVLQQVYRKGTFSRTDDIAVHGNGNETELTAQADLNGRNAQVIDSSILKGCLPIGQVMVVSLYRDDFYRAPGKPGAAKLG